MSSPAATAALGNSAQSYGTVTKALHWLTALLIISAFPLGMIAHELPYGTSEQLAFKATLFSLHKTVGVLSFFVALARIAWALTQPKPGLLHPDRKLEAFAAELVHWMLYGAMLLVPLTGWIHHAATTGFAPIWWPFGQNLFFVPKSEAVAGLFGGAHDIFTKLLLASVALHVAGALKHHVIDRDATLKRMLMKPVAAEVPAQTHSRTPFFAAVAIWAAAMGLAVLASLFGGEHDHDEAEGGADGSHETAVLDAPASEWQVIEGSLAISVLQMGSAVEGQFADWTAAISFDPAATDGAYGDVTVEIAIGSLTLGSVTSQAMGAEFFDAGTYPTATYTAQILAGDNGGYVADGMLKLKGVEAPVSFPFSLELEGDLAKMSGQAQLDRREFSVGTTSYKDESSVGFPVQVIIDLTAQRQN
ncbi:MAG: cytochrome b/b6 domain-containing protein [Mangrovicoccus sp.]